MEHNAKNFALQLGALISLYVSIGALLVLLFSTINIALPDPDQYSMWETESASSAIRSSIAALIVFFPAYLILTRIINKIRRTDVGTYTTFTKWLIYLSLLVGGGVLLVDLVTVINSFLEGELTTRFLLKALAVFIVVGASFAYYVLDARNYWHTHESESKRYGVGALVLVVLALVLGFMHTDSPTEVRAKNIDARIVSDLESMQYTIENHYAVNGSLPGTLADAYGTMTIPEAPSERAPYTYIVTGDRTYSLCAEFAFESLPTGYRYGPSWEHKAGDWCFERSIVDQKIPPVTTF